MRSRWQQTTKSDSNMTSRIRFSEGGTQCDATKAVKGIESEEEERGSQKGREDRMTVLPADVVLFPLTQGSAVTIRWVRISREQRACEACGGTQEAAQDD